MMVTRVAAADRALIATFRKPPLYPMDVGCGGGLRFGVWAEGVARSEAVRSEADERCVHADVAVADNAHAHAHDHAHDNSTSR
jgi:hypothetical protein